MEEEPGQSRIYRALAIAGTLGWPVAAGAALGVYLDGKLGSAPLLTLVLTLGAFVAAVRRLLQLVGSDEDEDG